MKCGYCSGDNAAEDLRCHLCGRRINSSGPLLVAGSYGNAVAKLEVLEERLLKEDVRSRQPIQTRLFPVQEPKRVIPFESVSAETAKVARSTQQRNAKVRNKAQPEGHTKLGGVLDDSPEVQNALDFREEHMETRTVERVVYTNAPVAPPWQRAKAGMYDLAIISVGVGILVTIYYLGGVQFGLAKLDLSTYSVVAASVVLLYKLLWALSDGDTPGMTALHLRLINFDGYRPNREERLLRLVVSIVSFASLGVGLLWCLFDEEKLTWHDHITKTFASPRSED